MKTMKKITVKLKMVFINNGGRNVCKRMYLCVVFVFSLMCKFENVSNKDQKTQPPPTTTGKKKITFISGTFYFIRTRKLVSLHTKYKEEKKLLIVNVE